MALFDYVPEKIIEADRALFTAINSGLYYPIGEAAMRFMANDVFLLAVLFILFAFFLKFNSPENRAAAAFSLWAMIVTNVVNSDILKPVFGRLRPPAEMDTVNFMVTMKKLGWAFPSTHTAMAAALITVLWGADKKADVFLVFCGVSVAFFCVYTGGHYPFDTFAGAGFGLVMGFIFRAAKKAYLKGVKGFGRGTN